MKVIPDSYTELISKASEYRDYVIPDAQELLERFGFQGLTHQAQSPVFFVVDYSKGKYLYIGSACKTVLGYDISFLADKGPLFYSALSHQNDYKIVNEYVMPESLKFLKNNPDEDVQNFSFSFNYRVKTRNGEYLTMLQRSTFFAVDPDGKPLAAVGFVTDISHFKEDTKIIHTVERVSKNFSALSKKTLYKKIYYPDKEVEVLSNRELEILNYIYQGFKSKTIADKLFISIHTVNNHRKNMLLKTNSKSMSEVLRYALSKSLL